MKCTIMVMILGRSERRVVVVATLDNGHKMRLFDCCFYFIVQNVISGWMVSAKGSPVL
jgi:hypothetical protein